MIVIVDYKLRYEPKDTKGEILATAYYYKNPVKPNGMGLQAMFNTRPVLDRLKSHSVLSVWTLLCQFATDHHRDKKHYRGLVLNHKDEPATFEELVVMLRMEGLEDTLKENLEILKNLRWIEEVPDEEFAFIKPAPETKSETESEQCKVGPKKERSKFVKPILIEINDYAKTINFALDGQEFIDFYESKGWLIGKTPMKDWRAAVRTWQRRSPQKQALSRKDISCLVCHKPSAISYNGKYLCGECQKSFRSQVKYANWGNLTLTQIEKIVLEGKALLQKKEVV